MEKRKPSLASIVSHLKSIMLEGELIRTFHHNHSYEKNDKAKNEK